jgi:hypothetical protein
MCGRIVCLRDVVTTAARIAILIATSPLSARVIDDFSVGGTTVVGTTTPATLQTQAGLDPNHVVGGGRNISVGGSGASVQTLNIDTGAGELRFLTGKDTTSGLGYFDITYGTVASPLNLDLTSGGANAFYFVTKWDVGGTLFDQPPNFFNVFTAAGESTSSVSNIRGGVVTVLPDGGRQVIVPFSAFTPKFDPAKILRIELDFVRIAQGSTFTLSAFRTIPEPSAGVLLAVAMIGGVFCGRLRRRVWRCRRVDDGA